MIDITKKYKTRDGAGVRIYAADGIGPYPVHGARATPCGWLAEKWTANGSYAEGTASAFDLIPVPTLRPWTHGECPVVFMARKKASPKGMSSAAWRHDHSRHGLCQGVNFFPAKVDGGTSSVINLSFSALAADYVRILEDGSEVPCGVEE